VLAVLDANVLIADFGRQSNAFRLTLGQAARLGITVSVPEVAIIEATRNYAAQLREAEAKLRKATANLGRLQVDVDNPFGYPLQVEARVKDWEAQLRSQFSEPGRRILPLPDVSHADVLDRLRSGRPPTRDGRGYGDTLIWETVVAQASHGEPVVLVSNDADFAGRDEARLNESLTWELGKRSRGASVELCRGLAKFVEQFIGPNLAAFEHFWERFGATGLADEIERLLAEQIEAEGVAPDVLVDPGNNAAQNAWIIGVEDMSDVIIEEARQTPDGRVFFEVSADVQVRVEYLIDTRTGGQPPLRDLALAPQPAHIQHGVDSRFIGVTAEGSWQIGTERLERFTIRKIESTN
jgi:hypothetical protein